MCVCACLRAHLSMLFVSNSLPTCVCIDRLELRAGEGNAIGTRSHRFGGVVLLSRKESGTIHLSNVSTVYYFFSSPLLSSDNARLVCACRKK